MIKGKKALSVVIASILLVLLAFSAAIIVANFAVPFVKNNLNEGTVCFDYTSYFIFDEESRFNCYIDLDQNPGPPYDLDYKISVKAKTTKPETEEKVEGFKLLFKKNDQIRVAEVKQGTGVDNREGGIRMLDPNLGVFSIPKHGEVKSYLYNSAQENFIFETLEIYPILKSEKLCEKSDSIKINTRCS